MKTLHPLQSLCQRQNNIRKGKGIHSYNDKHVNGSPVKYSPIRHLIVRGCQVLTTSQFHEYRVAVMKENFSLCRFYMFLSPGINGELRPRFVDGWLCETIDKADQLQSDAVNCGLVFREPSERGPSVPWALLSPTQRAKLWTGQISAFDGSRVPRWR